MGEMVGVQGFEPWKAEPTDLQSVPFDRSGTLPNSLVIMCNFQAAARFERCFRSSELGHNTLGIYPVSTLYTPPGMSIFNFRSTTPFASIKTPGQAHILQIPTQLKNRQSEHRLAVFLKTFFKKYFLDFLSSSRIQDRNRTLPQPLLRVDL